MSLAPLAKRLAKEFGVFGAKVPVEVVMEIDFRFVPGSAVNLAAVGKHDVVAERERAVRLNACELQRLILAKGKDVVADYIVVDCTFVVDAAVLFLVVLSLFLHVVSLALPLNVLLQQHHQFPVVYDVLLFVAGVLDALILSLL